LLRTEMIKLLDKNTGKNFDFGLGNEFWGMTPKA
jgi:hypothetical protein